MTPPYIVFHGRGIFVGADVPDGPNPFRYTEKRGVGDAAPYGKITKNEQKILYNTID